jgi:hypothetical protein
VLSSDEADETMAAFVAGSAAVLQRVVVPVAHNDFSDLGPVDDDALWFGPLHFWSRKIYSMCVPSW